VSDRVRYKVLLAKAQIVSLQQGELGTKFKAVTPNGLSLEADLSFHPDVRVGDICSIYTELWAHVQPTTSERPN
jgi:hypothetical protein